MQEPRIQVAILDDYQNVAMTSADWSPVSARADVTVFGDHLADADAVIERLAPFDAVMVMRERTPLPRNVIERLPKLRMIASTGPANASIDIAAAEAAGIHVAHTEGTVAATVELTWALILGAARHVVTERQAVAGGGWQSTVGRELDRRVLGVLGLGRIGTQVARIADVLTIHLKLGERTRGLVGAAELAAMKPTALLVNTSRGPIVEEAALLAALTSGSIAGAALDVYDTEPLPADHPLRTMGNVLATPHLGYVANRPYEVFFRDAVDAIAGWLDGE